MALECRLKGWKLWTLTVPAFAFVLTVDLVAVLYAVWLAARVESVAGLATVLVLAASALAAIEGARRVESRRRKGGALHKDLAPAWLLGGAIALQPAAAVVVALLLRTWWRLRAGRCIPYRWVFSTAVIVLAIGAAHTVYGARSPAGSAPAGSGLRPGWRSPRSATWRSTACCAQWGSS
jgi:hypothetical protein